MLRREFVSRRRTSSGQQSLAVGKQSEFDHDMFFLPVAAAAAVADVAPTVAAAAAVAVGDPAAVALGRDAAAAAAAVAAPLRFCFPFFFFFCLRRPGFTNPKNPSDLPFPRSLSRSSRVRLGSGAMVGFNTVKLLPIDKHCQWK